MQYKDNVLTIAYKGRRVVENIELYIVLQKVVELIK